jgi:signal transduction protein with GAF and PtsI domain
MTLDTLVRTLGTECCWVQTLDSSKLSLQLAAERGFNSEMRREISAMDMSQGFGRQVAGLANSIVIPDLARDGRYGLKSFGAAGYRWLLAMPLMTYRVHGVLGFASRSKKMLRKETPELARVIAGLIGTALNKAGLSGGPALTERTRQSPPEAVSQSPAAFLPEKTPAVDMPSAPQKPPLKNGPEPPEAVFSNHAHKMNTFRRLHH